LKGIFSISSASAKVARDSFVLAAERFVRMGTGFVAFVLFARELGPAQFGELNYALAIIALLVPVAQLGLEPVAIREIIRRPEDAKTIVDTSLCLRLGAAAASTLLALALAVLVPGTGFNVAGLVLLASFMYWFQSTEVVDYMFLSSLRVRPLVLARALGAVSSLALKIFLISIDADITYFALASSFDALFIGGFTCLAYRTVFKAPLSLTWSRTEARRLLSDSWPLILTGLLVILFMRLDQIMLAHFSTALEVGKYSAAIKIIEVWLFIPNAVSRAVYPQLVRSTEESREELSRFLGRFFSLVFYGAVLIAILNVVALGTLIPLLFGPEYAGSIPVAMILSCSLLFTFSGEVRAQAFFVLNLKRFHVPSAIIGIIVVAALNFVFIPPYGAVGAAISTVIGYAVSAVMSSFLFTQTRWVGKLQVGAPLLRRK
jgi:polysaccharide transporter, PST family